MRLLDYAVKEDVDIEGDKGFRQKFSIKGPDKNAIKQFFNADFKTFLLANDKYHIESRNNELLIFRYFRVMTIGEIEEIVQFGENITGQFHKLLSTKDLIKPLS
jgi:hypothetical protein